jgi:small GTP-binding protein
MLKASKGMRLQIGIFGRRNAGKSSVLNAITRQDVSIVSAVAGTTTDPIEKPMELLPFGPVLFIDTAGLDDLGALGEKRIERSRKLLNALNWRWSSAMPRPGANLKVIYSMNSRNAGFR